MHKLLHSTCINSDSKSTAFIRDVTDSESASESDGIRHFFNLKSDGYLKSDRDGFTDLETFVSVHLYNYFRK